MAASAYRVMSTQVENDIFKRSWNFRQFCIYKQPTLTKKWNFNIFVQILNSYFRYTGRLFLGCALFVARCNSIRTSWETKKEKLSYRKTYVEEFVWGISLFNSTLSFLCLFLLSSSTLSTFQVMHLRNGRNKDTYIAMSGTLCVNGRKYENL